MTEPKIYIGTSGWSYRHWSGPFYPETLKPDRYLEFYFTRFDCVELNSSFYHLPRASTVNGWMERTPGAFRFCPKMSRYITHIKRLADIDEPLQNFFSVFGPVKERLGPILIQFPPGLKYDAVLSEDFFIRLKEQYAGFRFAAEIRHRSWINDAFLHLLSNCGIAFVIADSGGRFPYFEVATTDFVYFRFHGPENLYASNYDESKLLKYAALMTN